MISSLIICQLAFIFVMNSIFTMKNGQSTETKPNKERKIFHDFLIIYDHREVYSQVPKYNWVSHIKTSWTLFLSPVLTNIPLRYCFTSYLSLVQVKMDVKLNALSDVPFHRNTFWCNKAPLSAFFKYRSIQKSHLHFLWHGEFYSKQEIPTLPPSLLYKTVQYNICCIQKCLQSVQKNSGKCNGQLHAVSSSQSYPCALENHKQNSQ